jgi:VanZ family protein
MSALGAAIEVAQGTMGLGRDMDIHDWIADSCGVLLALVILLTCVPRRHGSWLRWVESIFGR